MTRLRQLQLLCQAVDNGLNLSSTARNGFTSQPSVSRHLQALEDELGVPVFVRSRRRICGLTSAGREVLETARRVLHELESLGELAHDAPAAQRGTITIAASHSYARYVLPTVVRTFMAAYPDVRLVLRQGDPQQLVDWVAAGEADLAICAETGAPREGLVSFTCNQHERVVVMPAGHRLARRRRVTLQELGRERLITYDAKFSLHRRIVEAFRAEGLEANIVLTATDVDVMKTYVRSGLGIAIVASIAWMPEEDTDLHAISASHLFAPATIKVVLRKGAFLRSFVFAFIASFAPQLRRDRIQRALSGH